MHHLRDSDGSLMSIDSVTWVRIGIGETNMYDGL